MIKILILSVLSLISTVNADCNVNGETYECTDITQIPEILPKGTTSLLVQHSPNLLTISFLPPNIVALSLVDIGVADFAAEAIVNVSTTLNELYIKEAHNLTTIDLGKPKSANRAMTKLVIMNCSELYQIDNIAQYENLASITITSTALQSIQSDMFEGLGSVTTLDISYNYQLTYIRSNAFEDMIRLRSMNMNGCRLSKLYGNYFNAPYERGTLNTVTTLGNNFKCDQMCDFTTWYWGHTGFYEKGLIGFCEDGGYAYLVYDLSRYAAGCQPIFWIIFGSILGALLLISIAMCVFVALCGINYRDYCCCCLGSRRNRRNSFSEGTRDHTEVDTFHIDVSDPHKPHVPMYESTPPTYDECTIPISQAAETTPAVPSGTTQTSTSST